MYTHWPSGLNLTLYRAYNADAGRWLNRDPIEEAGGNNLFRFVDNNPINYLDVLGLAGGAAEPGPWGPGTRPSPPLPEQPETPGENIPGSGDYFTLQLEHNTENAFAWAMGTPEGWSYGDPQNFNYANGDDAPLPPPPVWPSFSPIVFYPPMTPGNINAPACYAEGPPPKQQTPVYNPPPPGTWSPLN
jgi:RHS repeat-associated protein